VKYKTINLNQKMKTTRFFTILTIIATIIFMEACKGEKGDIGPSGANGTNGTNGSTGATGQTGATGATGTTNVFYSDWLDLIPNKLPSRETTIIAPKITQNVMDNSDVRVYIKIGSLVSALPYADLSSWLLLGKVVIAVAGNSTINTGLKVRYIIIPGGTSIGSGRISSVDYTDYEAVMAYYDLKD
jgi:hypothetical protein